MQINKEARIYIAGHKGLIGSAVERSLFKRGYKNVICKDKSELDLINQHDVWSFFEKERPDYVFLCAAKMGGVYANTTYKADYIYENLMIQNNVISSAFKYEVKKLINFSSSDVYPVDYEQPAREENLFSGKLENTCDSYALAKLTGIKLCQSYNFQYGTDFITIIASNVYGRNQRYDQMNSMVLPALIRRFHEAKVNNLNEVVVWGTGTPVRDFIFSDDLAEISMFLLENACDFDLYNIGTGVPITIRRIAEIIKDLVGFSGEVIFDSSKPEGVKKKILDINRIIQLYRHNHIDIVKGIEETYKYYLYDLKNKKVRLNKINYLYKSEKDCRSLKELSSISIKNNSQPANYIEKVVLKPWGYEFLVFENSHVAVWFLYIKSGFSTSMHCHQEKITSLVLLSGSAMCNTFSFRNNLNSLSGLVIDKGVFHSTKAISENGIMLLEIESPPDKTDLLRLKDRYGRADCGYEGIAEMRSDGLDDYSYFSFRDNVTDSDTFTINDCVVTFKRISSRIELNSYAEQCLNHIWVLCSGEIYEGDVVVMKVSEARFVHEFCKRGNLDLTNDILVLNIYKGD